MTIHWRFDDPRLRSRCIVGRATFTTTRSRIIMNWAPHTKARIMAGRLVPLAADATLVVEAAKRSGTGLFLQLSTKSFKPAGGALFARARLLMAVEERARF